MVIVYFHLPYNVFYFNIDYLLHLDHFEIDIDFIANNKMYQLQVQNSMNIDYGQVNDSDDADDEEEN